MVILICLNFVFSSGRFIETYAEIFRWLLLIFSAMCFSSVYKKHFSLGIYSGITFSAVLGILAYFKIIPAEPFGSLQLAAEVDGYFQLFSVFGYSNTAAVFFGTAVFLGLIFFEDKILPPMACILIAVNALAMYLTHSNFAIICLLFGLLGFYFFKNKKLKLFFAIIFLLFIAGITVVLLFPGAVGSTVISRVIYVQDALTVLKPFGIGFGEWAELKYSVQSAVYSTDYLHNGYLQLLLEGGFHVFIAFIGFIFLLIKGLIRSDKPLIFALTLFILLHSFFDIDLTYGAVYILLGFAVSHSVETSIPNKKFRYISFGLSVLTVLSAVYLLFGFGQHISTDKLKTKIENNTVTATELSALYKGAKTVHDAHNMYAFSILWLEKAPRSQEAFSAVYESIDKIYAATLDEKYLTVSRPALYNRMDSANKSMNMLCRYLSKNQYIELP